MTSPVQKKDRLWPAIAGLAVMTIFLWSGALHAQPKLAFEQIATGLARPVAVTNAGDGSGRLFITLQGGQIVIYDGIEVLPTPFLDVSSLVTTGGERGLLSVAFHPNYAVNGYFYVDYTNLAGNTVIARYSVSGNPDVANPASSVILLTIPQPYLNHNGGQLQFGPDGYLYIGMGDGGGPSDPLNNAQNLNSLLGKILRIDVDGGFPYAIPTDNPFAGDPAARDEIWALGLRNPWRFSFDRLNGDLFIADVGQANWEELDFQPAGSPGGQNYGWKLMEGSHCYIPATGCNDGSLTLPVFEYPHTLGCAITGGYRYWGNQSPGLLGIYLCGDYCTGRIFGAEQVAGGSWTTSELADTAYLITTFGEDEDGEIYVADVGSGSLYRISNPVCKADFGGNGVVDQADYALFAADFGRVNCAGGCNGDFDNDGDVDGLDAVVMAFDFGRTDCP